MSNIGNLNSVLVITFDEMDTLIDGLAHLRKSLRQKAKANPSKEEKYRERFNHSQVLLGKFQVALTNLEKMT